MKFDPDEKNPGGAGKYSKRVFAERVVKPNADTADFTGFEALFDRIQAVIEDYASP